MAESNESEFRESWVATNEFFTHIVTNYDASGQMRPMLDLIAKFVAAGYDTQFRAGQSLNDLVISRAAKHGMDRDFPSINFFSRGNEVFDLRFWTETKQMIQYDFRLSEFEPTENECVYRLNSQPIQ